MASNADVCLRERIDHARQMSRLAFNEHADLLNAHYSAPLSGKFTTGIECAKVRFDGFRRNALGNDFLQTSSEENPGAWPRP